MTPEEIIAAVDPVPGWMHRAELHWLVNTAKALPAGATWIEIGCYRGRSLLAVGLALPGYSTLIGIDHSAWQTIGDDPSPRLTDTLPQLVAARPDLRLILIRATADVAARQIFAAADVVFIDADHSYAGTSREIRDFKPLLKEGGRLCGHDYDLTHWPGVVQAVDELLPQRELIPGGSIWSVIT